MTGFQSIVEDIDAALDEDDEIAWKQIWAWLDRNTALREDLVEAVKFPKWSESGGVWFKDFAPGWSGHIEKNGGKFEWLLMRASADEVERRAAKKWPKDLEADGGKARHIADAQKAVEVAFAKLGKKEWLTVEEMEEICPECAVRMRENGIKAYKVSAMLDFVDEQGGSKSARLKARFIDPETGRFKGGKGERFENCVQFQLARGIKPKTSGDSTEDAARKLCSFIGRAAGRI